MAILAAIAVGIDRRASRRDVPPTIASNAGRRLVFAAGMAAWACRSLSSASAQATAPPEPASLEYEVKAAYLLNFTRYVEWPASAFSDEGSPLVICVIGRDPFGAILERTVEGQVTDGHVIRILRAPLAADARGCHVAFAAPATGDPRVPSFDASSPPVLTVGEGPDFAREGGMIGLVIVDATVRFEINLDAVRRAGLRVSSRVLALASHVYGKSGGE
ncbi:MAG: YfiR family protein [Gemmatimonadales bacterium]